MLKVRRIVYGPRFTDRARVLKKAKNERGDGRSKVE